MKPGAFLFAIGFFAFAFSSCKKDSTFKSITVSGVVIDSSTGGRIANTTCELYWANQYQSKISDLTTTTTDANGNFTIETKIDVSKFSEGNVLVVEAKTPSGYFNQGDWDLSRTKGVVSGYQKTSAHRLWFYQKTNLAITLRRTFNDSYTTFGFYHNWNILIPISNFQAPLTVFNVFVPAGPYNYVRWVKVTGGTLTSFQDSIRCLPAVNNAITVNY